MVSVWCGANRFLHTEVTRHDGVLARVFGWKRTPGQDTFKRFFSKSSFESNHELSQKLFQWVFQKVKFDDFTLDCDSTVITRYGSQSGARKGYNPHKPGRNSHHPIMAFVADIKLVANFWLRSGNSPTAADFATFLEDTLEKLYGKTISLLRLDSGFYSKEVFDFVESKNINYVVAARLHRPLQKQLAYGQQVWTTLDDGIEISQSTYQASDWSKARRIIMVRQRIEQRPKATGKVLRLFSEDEIVGKYRYSCYFTNLTLPPAEVWRLYRGRADSENRIKELKTDFGFDSFNLSNFAGTESAMLFVILGYNLMAMFRQFIIGSKVQNTLSTLRYKTFAVGSYIEELNGQLILKMSLNLKRREWFTSLWNNSKSRSAPFVFSNA